MLASYTPRTRGMTGRFGVNPYSRGIGMLFGTLLWENSMNVHATSFPRWNTSSFAANGETVARDLSSLGAHVESCNGCKGRWFTIRCALESLHSFVAPRVVTTLVVAVGIAVVVAAAV